MRRARQLSYPLTLSLSNPIWHSLYWRVTCQAGQLQPIMRGAKIMEELTSGKGREESHMAIEENLLVRDQLLDRRRRRDAGAEEA